MGRLRTLAGDHNKLLGPAPEPQEPRFQVVPIDDEKYRATKDHLAALRATLAPLAANPHATHEDYLRAGANLVAAGRAKPEEFLKIVAELPSDPAGLNAWAIQNHHAVADTDRFLDALYAVHSATGGR